MKVLTRIFPILILILINLILIKSNGLAQDHSNKETVIKKIDGKTVSALTLDRTIPVLIDSADIPAISIAVINNSQILYSRPFGFKNIKTKVAIDQNTKFEAASLTKPILAYITLKLVDEGKLELDKPLYQYLEYDDIKQDERYKLITARIVLNHTSGFPNWRRMNPDKKLDIKFTPGEKFSYSGEGYVYLQKVIEKIMGKRLDKVAKEKVFVPLKMNNSSLLLKNTANYAVGHTHDIKVKEKWKPEKANGASSLHTTANDYAKFLIAILKHQGVSEKSINEMLSPQISISETDSTLFWGLGFALENKGDETYFWHWGDNDIFRAFTIISKERKTGIVYFTNSMNGLNIFKRIVDLTLGGNYSLCSWLNYAQYDSPEYIIPKTIINNGLEAGIEQYKVWKNKHSHRFKESTLNSIGYYFLAKEKNKEAIEIFKLNVVAYPNSFNVYDSLGEAYMENGNKELAIKNYEKSIRLNPDNYNGIEALKNLKND